MGTFERSLLIGTVGAGVGGSIGLAGDVFKRKAEDLEPDSFLRGLLETKQQTEQRLADAASYEDWASGLHWLAIASFFITAVAVVATLRNSKGN